jgi:Phosphoesterase family
MSSPVRALIAAVATAAGAMIALPPAAAAAAAHYDHIFVIVEENHGFSDVIGNPAAPNLNALAKTYGLATHYYGVSHPSEPNYVALLGGSTFTVRSDDAYYVQRVHAPSLISELDRAGITWKAYLQSVPHPGYQGICYPANCNGEPDKDPLYASKHNAIPNFTTSLNPADWSRQVPIGELGHDLHSGHVPAFNWVIPDECRDEHGDPPYCIDSGNTGGGDPQDQRLVSVGDQYLGQLVEEITSARFWAKGNNAIDIVYDEGDGNTHGGGHTVNVMVTSHGPRHVQAPAFYNHYSLLQTIQRNFGLACLQHTCDTAHVTPMTPLLKVTGSSATAFKPLPEPGFATPSPVPAEPVTYSKSTVSSAGWTVQHAPVLGTNDNSLGAVAAVAPDNVWAAGNFLPDTSTSNQDATLAAADHFNGTKWVSTSVPDAGPNFNTLFGIAAAQQKAWAVGVALDAGYQAHSLIEAWDGGAWHIVAAPKLHAQRDILFSATAVSPTDVWAVGEQQAGDGTFGTLIEHWNGSAWSVVRSPDPGKTGNTLFGVAADGPGDVWAVGQRSNQTSDAPLAEHWNGHHWSAVGLPTAGVTGSLLQSVAVRGGEVWAAGQSDDARDQARPFVEHLSHGTWSAQLLKGIGSGFSNITGVAVTGKTAWLVGSALNEASGNQLTVVARNDGAGWQRVAAPNPGSGDRILGGISATGGRAWAVGAYDTSARTPLIEAHK